MVTFNPTRHIVISVIYLLIAILLLMNVVNLYWLRYLVVISMSGMFLFSVFVVLGAMNPIHRKDILAELPYLHRGVKYKKHKWIDVVCSIKASLLLMCILISSIGTSPVVTILGFTNSVYLMLLIYSITNNKYSI